MRIAGLSIDGFGIFRDVELGALPAGLAMFLGDNEAGKSTTLGFVHTVLFGYPDGRSKENAYPSINGGESGGRLVLETESVGRLTIERRTGKRGGPVSVRYADGRSDGQPALTRLLGGTTKPLYRSLYAFSLHELERIETLTDNEVRDVIYGASLGTNARSFPEARKRLSNRIGELFKRGGSKPEINRILRNLEEVRGTLREARNGIEHHARLTRELSDIEDRIATARTNLHSCRERHERLKAWIQLWEDWVSLQDAESQLADLAAIVKSFPNNGKNRLTALLDKLNGEEAELREAEEAIRQKQASLEHLTIDTGLLAQAAEIRAVIRRVGVYEQAVQELPVALEHLKFTQRQAEEVLTEFGEGWTEGRVLALDQSPTVRSSIEEHRENQNQSMRRAEKAREREEEERSARDEAANRAQTAQDRAEELRVERTDMPSGLLVSIREGRSQFQTAIRDIPKLELRRHQAVSDIDSSLREISPSWTPEILIAFDSSLTARELVVDFEKRLTEAVAAERDAERAVELARRSYVEAEEALAEKTDEIGRAAAETEHLETLIDRKKRIRSLREAVLRRETTRSMLRAREETAQILGSASMSRPQDNLANRMKTVALVMTFMALLAGAGFWFGVGPEVGSTAGGLLLIVAIVLFVLSRSAAGKASWTGESTTREAKDAIEGLRADLDNIREQIEEIMAHLGVQGEADSAIVDQLEDQNAAQTRVAEDLAVRRKELGELRVAMEREKEARETAASTLREARHLRAAAEEDWTAHAESINLPLNTSPRTAGLLFEKTETAFGQYRQIADFDNRLSEMRTVRDEYLQFMEKIPALQQVVHDADVQQYLDTLAIFLAELDQEEQDARAFAEAESKAKIAEENLSHSEERLREAVAESHLASTAEVEAQTDWSMWLRERSVDDKWSPDTYLRLLDRAARLRELVVGRDEASATAERHARVKEEYMDEVGRLSDDLGRRRPAADAVVVEVHDIESALKKNDARQTIETQIRNEMPALESRCESRRSRIAELKKEVQDLIKAGGADNEEQFRTRAELFEAREALLAAIGIHANNVRRISGETDFQILQGELRTTTLPALLADRDEGEPQIAAEAMALEQLQKERTQMDDERKRLLNEDAIAKLRAKEESLLEQFRESAEEWGRHAIALHLLNSAKERFEKAHQPEVIREASRYFSSITGEEYTRVFAPHGEESIEVIDARERAKSVEILSRGTAEQLYLAIRFGYIASDGGRREKLPILMDDALASKDGWRRRFPVKSTQDHRPTERRPGSASRVQAGGRAVYRSC